MAGSHVVQSNFLSGVLDPRAAARIETDAYNNGLLRGINIEPIHLGGVRRRRGLRRVATLANQLTRIHTGVTITAANGGTTANANDDSETTKLTTTTNISTTNPYVVVHYDLGSAQTVYFADVIGLALSAGSSTQFEIQYSTDNASWTIAGSAFELVDTTARTYRRVPNVSARYWRVVRIGATDLGTAKAELVEFNLWQNGSTLSESRIKSFEVSTSERYIAVFTDRTVAIYSNETLVAYQPTPYASADIPELDVATNAETMAIVHEDYPPQFLIRETTTNFQRFPMDFDSIPQIDFADSSSPSPTSDVQVITFAAGWNAGDTFQITLDGARTATVVYAGDNATTADNITREVQKLWSVQGFNGVSCSRTGSAEFTVTLAEDSASAYGDMTVSPLSSSSTASVNHSVTGVPRREPVWSSTRGYPRTVEFFEGRLYFGGTKQKQQSIIGSQVNNILGFEIGEGLADDPVFTTLNGGRLTAIQGLFGGRSLQLFTSGGEFRYAKELGTPISPGDAPVNQTQYGAAKIKPVTIDGATIYVQRNKKSIRDFRFDYTENAYNSLGVSSLAPHLIYDVRDMAAWNGSAIDEISFVLVVNGTNPDTSSDAFPDGSVAIFNSRKEAQIQAWTIWTTDGQFKSVCSILEDIYFTTKRTLNGVDYSMLEIADVTCYTDCAHVSTNSPAAASVTGASHLYGEECRVRADGFVLENVTPDVSGNATLSKTVSAVEVGLDWTVEATPMPLQTITPQGSNLMRKKRVVKVRAKVRNTLGLLVNGRPLPDRYFDVDDFDEAATPFTGVHTIEESTNWDESEDKLVSFTQVDPLPFELLGLDIQIEGSI